MESFTSTMRSTSSRVPSAVNATSLVVISIIFPPLEGATSPQIAYKPGAAGCHPRRPANPRRVLLCTRRTRLASGETRNFEEVHVGVGRARYGGNHVVGARPRGVRSRRR